MEVGAIAELENMEFWGSCGSSTGWGWGGGGGEGSFGMLVDRSVPCGYGSSVLLVRGFAIDLRVGSLYFALRRKRVKYLGASSIVSRDLTNGMVQF